MNQPCAFRPFSPLALSCVLLALTGTAVMAHPRGWSEPGWGPEPWPEHAAHQAPSPEGRIEVARFRAAGDPAAALAKGPLAVIAAPEGENIEDQRVLAAYEAAVVDRAAHAGYDTANAAPAAGQVAEVRVRRAEVMPAEAPHKPVSGSMAMGVSNHGSMMGMALMIDGTKPRKALLSTRLEVRVRDRASGQILWEGRAEMVSRDGDEKWNDQAIAGKLSAVLFDGFPNRTGEDTLRR